MHKKFTGSLILAIALAIFTGLFSVSCKKTKPCEAIITVIDTLGRPVSEATVILRQDSVISQQTGLQANIIDQKVTDFNGQSQHTIKWEAVLNVEVIKANLKARDYIRLEQSKTVEKTITLRK